MRLRCSTCRRRKKISQRKKKTSNEEQKKQKKTKKIVTVRHSSSLHAAGHRAAQPAPVAGPARIGLRVSSMQHEGSQGKDKYQHPSDSPRDADDEGEDGVPSTEVRRLQQKARCEQDRCHWAQSASAFLLHHVSDRIVQRRDDPERSQRRGQCVQHALRRRQLLDNHVHQGRFAMRRRVRRAHVARPLTRKTRKTRKTPKLYYYAECAWPPPLLLSSRRHPLPCVN